MSIDNLVEYSYPITVTFIFVAVYFFFRLKINRAEKRKIKSLRKREIVDAVETDSPVEDQNKVLKKKGIHGLVDRFSFIRKAFPVVLILIWCIVVFIPYLGNVPTVYVSIVAAVISVIAGVSLRPFLENLFSGVVISFFKSIKVGDTVTIDGHYGLIEEIGLVYSVIKRWDWNRVVIPNTQLMQKEIENLSMNDQFIWAHIEFYVSQDADLELIESISKKVATQSQYFNGNEEPSFWVMGMEKDSIKCWVAAWADNASDAWELRNDIRTGIIKAFKKEGISFHQYNIQQQLLS